VDDVRTELEPDEEMSDDGEVQRAIDLGTFTVDELDAICPGRHDMLGGSPADAEAGARSLVARGLLQMVPDPAASSLELESAEALTVAASFLSTPERTLLLRREDLLGTDSYALYGQTVEDEGLCYVLELGSPGIRRLLFVVPEHIVFVAATLVGLADTGAAPGEPAEPVDVDVDALDPDSPLARALAAPVHLVTAMMSSAGAPTVELSFVHGDDDAWICEWTGARTARVTPLDDATAAAALARILK
jgi:hypothetical protein